jgi:CspA family cold shock protein
MPYPKPLSIFIACYGLQPIVQTAIMFNIDQNVSMPRGKVIFFNKKSKFGFIKGADDQTDYYVALKNLVDDVQPDDEVEFDIQIAKRGPEAVNVKKAGAR